MPVLLRPSSVHACNIIAHMSVGSASQLFTRLRNDSGNNHAGAASLYYTPEECAQDVTSLKVARSAKLQQDLAAALK